LKDVLYAPEIQKNELSVEKLMSRGYQVNFGGMKAGINWNGRQIAVAGVDEGFLNYEKNRRRI
jgi:hypothetical protein